MPLFMVKRESFEWVRSGRKCVEVRKRRMEKGDEAVFLCSKWMLKVKIVRKEQGKLSDVVNGSNFRDVIPVAKNLREALSYIERLYGKSEDEFTAYYFKLTSKRPKVIM
jgi:ASC-1-like (ASCH) protein